ncbi:MAG: ferredoxin [Chloroflexota bacterium]
MSGRRALDSGMRLEINRIACDAYGTCAELLPEGIDLDEWGYPIIAPGNVPMQLLDLAKRAVDGCPVLALRLVKRSPRPPRRRPRPCSPPASTAPRARRPGRRAQQRGPKRPPDQRRRR